MMTPRNILDHMRLDEGLYVIGCFERRVTLYSQQVRALNLAFALHHEGLLTQQSSVAVIGGGAAGMTAAAGIATKGAHVALIEQRSDLIQLFQGNVTRWIHPHIYDWPEHGSEGDEAGIPLMNWSADYAARVAEQFTCAWDALPSATQSRIDTRLGATLESAQHLNDGSTRLAWNTKEGTENKRFDVVIIAAGFGLERSSNNIPVTSYWRNDDLDQPDFDTQRRTRRILVSGCGDGGLIEVIRARIRNFRHDQIVADFLKSKDDVDALAERLLSIEREAFRRDGLFLFDSYSALDVPLEIDRRIKHRLRSDTSVVLNGRDSSPLTNHASMLNRFLVSRLCRYGGVTYVASALRTVETTSEGYRVTFDEGGRTEMFDRVILRHGPADAVSSLARLFPQIIRMRDTLRAVNALDQTRTPIWENGAFGELDRTPPESVRQRGEFTVVFRHPDAPSKQLTYRISDFDRFQGLADELYFESRADGRGFTPFMYGSQWVLVDRDTGKVIMNMRMIDGHGPGVVVPDNRSLREVGIQCGMTLDAVPPPKKRAGGSRVPGP